MNLPYLTRVADPLDPHLSHIRLTLAETAVADRWALHAQ